MEPAHSIISLFATPDEGGPSIVASILGTSRMSVYRWTYAREKGGTGGTIPQRYHQDILSAAEKRGLPLRAEHLLPGQKPIFEVAA